MPWNHEAKMGNFQPISSENVKRLVDKQKGNNLL